MANRHRIICITRWVLDGDERLSLAAQLAPDNVSVNDLTGQQADVNGEVRTAPNILIVEVSNLTNGQRTAFEGDDRFYVLARQTWDTADDGLLTFDNFDNAVTAGQVSTFISDIQNRYPDVDTDHLEDAGQAAIEAGLTRQQVIRRLVRRWKRFLKVLG